MTGARAAQRRADSGAGAGEGGGSSGDVGRRVGSMQGRTRVQVWDPTTAVDCTNPKH